MTRCFYISCNQLFHVTYKRPPLSITRRISLHRWRNKVKAWNLCVFAEFKGAAK